VSSDLFTRAGYRWAFPPLGAFGGGLMLRFPRALSDLPPAVPENAFGFGAGLAAGVVAG